MTYLRACCPRGLTSLEVMIQDLAGIRLFRAATRIQPFPHDRYRSVLCSRAISSSHHALLNAPATATEPTPEETHIPRAKVKVPGTRKPLTLAKQARRIRRKERRLAEGKYRSRTDKVRAQIEESKVQYNEGVAAKEAATAMAREHLQAMSKKKQRVEEGMNSRELVQSRRTMRKEGRGLAKMDREKTRLRTDKRSGRLTSNQSQKQSKITKDNGVTPIQARSSDQADTRSRRDSSAGPRSVSEELEAIEDEYSTAVDSSALLSSMMTKKEVEQAELARVSDRQSSKEDTMSAESKSLANPSSNPPTKREPWQIQKKALERKFGDAGWSPRKRISPDSLNGIRALHASDPEAYSTEVLARHFEMSPEAIRRILKSKWRPTEDEARDRQERWEKRGKKKWEEMAEQGMRPPQRWRAMGVSWRERARSKAAQRDLAAKSWETGSARNNSRKGHVNTGTRSPGAPGFAHRIM